VGNACELAEAIDVLRGGGPADTRALTIRLGAEMLVLGKKAADRSAGARRIEGAIASGEGLEILRACVHAQGGQVAVIDDPARLPRAKQVAEIRAPTAGRLVAIDAGKLGRGSTLLGAGRLRKEDLIDPGVGLILDHKVGARVERAERLGTVYFNDRARWQSARALIESAFEIGPADARGRARPLILETIEDSGGTGEGRGRSDAR
jgi:thymidine phosphorylase